MGEFEIGIKHGLGDPVFEQTSLPILEGENIIGNGGSAIPKISFMVPWYKKWLNLGVRYNSSMFAFI